MDLSLEKDSKTELQEFLQKRQLPLPKYLNTSPKEGLFKSTIVSGQNKNFLGKGSSIKEAEKNAAENYLKHLIMLSTLLKDYPYGVKHHYIQ